MEITRTKKQNRRGMAMTLIALVMVFSIVLTACGGGETPAPTTDPAVIQTQAAQTVVADITQNAPPVIDTATPPPAPTEMAPAPGPTADPNVAVAVFPAPNEGEPTAVANYNTYIYSGPGTNYVVYGAFLGSATALVTGKSEDGLWWAVSVPVAPSGVGWVDAAWVTVSNVDGVPVLPTPPVPPTTDLVPPGPSDPQVTTLVNTYVRTGPGTNYPAYGIAPAAVTGRVIGKSQDSAWWTVRLNPENIGAGYGWVDAGSVQAANTADVPTIETPAASNPVPPPAPPEGVPVAVALEPVNVRSGPGTNYYVLVVAPAGAAGEVTGKSEDGAWWQVKIAAQFSADERGWVSAGYVLTENTQDVPVAAAPPVPPPVSTELPPTNACVLLAQTPEDFTVFAPNTAFVTSWQLKNTGAATWDPATTSIRFIAAEMDIRMHQGEDVYPLNNSVETGWNYTFALNMIAPSEPGPSTYAEAWAVVSNGVVVCPFWVYIEVQ